MIIKIEKPQCYGCGSCQQVCPKGCIAMEEDREGFLYPSVNMSACIHCNLCDEVCIAIHPSQHESTATFPKTYAIFSKNDTTRENSSSGGTFSELANWILENGGIVFGAAFDSIWKVHHVSVSDKQELIKLRGSKYLQSRVEDTYIQVKNNLLLNKLVLYTGTPCEIEGLLAFLGHDYSNLYTQDVICHGVPSTKLWIKNISYWELQYGSPMKSATFRNKEFGWKAFALKFDFANSETYKRIFSKDWYMQIFLRNIALRPSCYQCAFRTKNHISDITLADFWGCESICPDLCDNKGLSLAMVNTEKGKHLFDMIARRIVMREVDIEAALKANPSVDTAIKMPQSRKKFFKDMETMSMSKLAQKYVRENRFVLLFYRILNKVMRFIRGKGVF